MSHKLLEKYFHTIVNQPKKETAMSLKDSIKEYFSPLTSKWWTDKFSFVEKEDEFVQEPTNDAFEDSWSFQMYTGEWVDEDGEEHSPKLSTVAGETDGTWMEQLDKILGVLNEHYGYDIKSQVYYSVTFPMNIEGEAGYGRMLNDEVLQQLLLSYPEVYEVHPSMSFLTEKQ